MTPRDLYQLAEAINQVARSQATRTDLGDRAGEGTQELIRALLNRAAVERAATRLVDVTRGDARVRAYIAHMEVLLSKAERVEHKAAERLHRICAELNELAPAAIREADSAAEAGTKARLEVERLQAEVAAFRPPGDGVIEAASAADTEGDVFEQLRKLAELRDAEVLTDREFSQKKADLLSRL